MQGYQWVSAWTGSGPPSHQLLALTEEFQALQKTQQQQQAKQQQQHNDEALVEQVAQQAQQQQQQILEADARAWFEKWMALQSLKSTGHR